jgi:hypothetical protein
MLVKYETFGGQRCIFIHANKKAAFRLRSVKSQWLLALLIERNRGADVRRKSISQR